MTIRTTVQVSGEIDLHTGMKLRRQLLNALCHATDTLVLDLSRVTFCDAAGLSVLVELRNRARAKGVTVQLTGPSPFMSRLLRITGLYGGLVEAV